MIFAALAVDVGGWSAQASRTQAAADAAALAAAPLLPDTVAAAALARDIAAANGFEDGVDGVAVTTSTPRLGTMRVTISAPAERFLSGLVDATSFDIVRHADGTALAPVGMGSPTNVLGFGPYSLDGSQVANFWLLEGNDCTPGHFGDGLAARYIASPYCGDGLGLAENPRWKRRTDGREGGFFYVVEIPPGVSVSSTLMVLDPGKCPGYGSKPADQRHNNPGQGTELSFRQWSTAGTPLIPTDDTPTTPWWSSNECLEDLPYPSSAWTDQTQGWTTTPFTFPANSTGETEYHLIQTFVGDSTRHGWNHYSFWVRPNSGVNSCTSIGSNDCPSIGGETWLPARADGDTVGQAMELWLAEIGPEYAGRTLEVSVWDVGESMDNIQILAPTGESLDFVWNSDDPAHAINNASDTCGGNPCLWLDPVSNNYPPRYPGTPGWTNHWRFNGRLTTLSVPLDSQVDFPAYAVSGNGFWFRLRFEPTATRQAQEWATFSVSMAGDPIRLTD